MTPITSIDIWQAINSTPLAMAMSRSVSSESIFFFFMIWRIMAGPMPAILSLDSLRRRECEGSIQENMRPNISFFVAGLRSFLMALSPQKVKNIETFSPVAAAPLARTNVASALSRSSLKRINDLPRGAAAASAAVRLVGEPFSMTILCMPRVESCDTKRLPVDSHQARASVANPGSVALM